MSHSSIPTPSLINQQPPKKREYQTRDPRIVAMDYAESPDVAGFAKYILLRVAVSAGLGDGTQIHVGDSLIASIEASFAKEDPGLDVKAIIELHLGQRCGLPLQFETPAVYPMKPRTKNTRRLLAPSRALKVFARDGYQCLHCGSRNDLTVDHIVPVSRGGSDFLSNLQTLCRPCNSRKGARI